MGLLEINVRTRVHGITGPAQAGLDITVMSWRPDLEPAHEWYHRQVAAVTSLLYLHVQLQLKELAQQEKEDANGGT